MSDEVWYQFNFKLDAPVDRETANEVDMLVVPSPLSKIRSSCSDILLSMCFCSLFVFFSVERSPTELQSYCPNGSGGETRLGILKQSSLTFSHEGVVYLPPYILNIMTLLLEAASISAYITIFVDGGWKKELIISARPPLG